MALVSQAKSVFFFYYVPFPALPSNIVLLFDIHFGGENIYIEMEGIAATYHFLFSTRDGSIEKWEAKT